MKTAINKCSINDLGELQKISIETFTDTFGPQNTEENMTAYLDQAYTLSQLREELLQPNSHFYFIYLEGHLAGYLKINVNEAQTERVGENALEVERIYVRKTYKRNGLGNQLIRKAIDFAKEQNKDAIWLGVWEENAPALKFYKKMGFAQKGQHSFFMGTDEQTDLIMVKILEG